MASQSSGCGGQPNTAMDQSRLAAITPQKKGGGKEEEEGEGEGGKRTPSAGAPENDVGRGWGTKGRRGATQQTDAPSLRGLNDLNQEQRESKAATKEGREMGSAPAAVRVLGKMLLLTKVLLVQLRHQLHRPRQ